MIGKLGFETSVVFGWGRNKSEDMLPAKYLRQAQKPHHPIRIASLEKSESVFFMKQRSQTPISAISGRQA